MGLKIIPNPHISYSHGWKFLWEKFQQILVKIGEKSTPNEILTIFLDFFDWSTLVNLLQYFRYNV